MIDMVNNTIVGIMLLLCSIKDIRTKNISMITVAVSLVLVLILCPFRIELSIWGSLAGLLSGLFFIGISKITRGQIGMGDGIVLCTTGIGLGFWNNFLLITYGLALAAIFSAVLLILKKVKRKSTLPFVPFLLAAYMGIIFF